MTTRRNFLSLTAAAAAASTVPSVFAAPSGNHASSAATAAVDKRLPAKSPRTKLNNGVEMPMLGVGSFALPTIQAADVISFALQNGYRLVDTATNYGNEKEVGEGIARSGVDRSELFVTTKLWMEDFGNDQALRAFDKSLDLLGLEYLDLYLLHWPVPTDFEKTIAAYKALEKLYADKRIRAIGVSNFNPNHLEQLMSRTKVVPAINQIELHPYMTQQVLREVNEKHGIKTECWSPIGGVFTSRMKNPTGPTRILEDFVIIALAQKYKRTPAQVVLRWQTQQGRIVIPKSQHYERLLKNIDIFDFELSPEDLTAIDKRNCDLRGGPHPDTFDVAAFRAIVEERRNSA